MAIAVGVTLIMTVSDAVKVGVGVQVAGGAYAAARINVGFQHSHIQTGTHEHCRRVLPHRCQPRSNSYAKLILPLLFLKCIIC